MKRLLASLLIALLPLPVFAHDWSSVAYRLSQATAMLTSWDGEGFCSAFAIDKKRDYFLTAEHCVSVGSKNGGFLVDNAIPWVVYSNPDLDVAVLYVEGSERPDLQPRTKLIKVGMEVGGFGFALEDGIKAHFRAGNVSTVGTINDREKIWVIVDQAGIGGMSGGPMVDVDGKVVFVNQISDRQRHFAGRSIEEIHRATAQFWRK